MQSDSGRFQYIAELEKRIASLEKDMWRGNGKPGITTRVSVLEDCVDKLNATLTAINLTMAKASESRDTKQWAIILLLISVLITVILKGNVPK